MKSSCCFQSVAGLQGHCRVQNRCACSRPTCWTTVPRLPVLSSTSPRSRTNCFCLNCRTSTQPGPVMLLCKGRLGLEARHAAAHRSGVARRMPAPARFHNTHYTTQQPVGRAVLPGVAMRAQAGAAAVASNSNSAQGHQAAAGPAGDGLTAVRCVPLFAATIWKALPSPPVAPTMTVETHCSPSGLPRTAVVGVLGGGQLGRMMALAAVSRAGLLNMPPAAAAALRLAQPPPRPQSCHC